MMAASGACTARPRPHRPGGSRGAALGVPESAEARSSGVKGALSRVHLTARSRRDASFGIP